MSSQALKRRYRESPVIDALKVGLPRKSSLVIAVSGGVDSIALALGCQQLEAELGLTLAVAHFDHKLRDDSAEDADFVAAWCARLELKLNLGTPTTQPPKSNIESWAREERYRFLGSIRERISADWILTAHHRDDLLETTLVQLLQNREPRGILANDLQRRLLRPLLGVSREEIEAYVTGQGEAWREDPSNMDQRFLRNKVRAELIPFIREKFGPSSINSLTERSIQISDDIEYLRLSAAALANSVCEGGRACGEVGRAVWGSREWLRIFRETLRQTHRLNRWRVLEEALLPVVGYRVGRHHGLRVIKFLEGSRKVCELPQGISLVREAGGLLVRRLVGG